MVAPLLFLALGAFGVGPAQGHPHPRVIVDVVSVQGPQDRGDVEREFRSVLWRKVVKCYLVGAEKQPKLRGEARFKLRLVPEGKVRRVRPTGDATIDDKDVIACWARELDGLSMPKAEEPSDVVLQIHVAPGDAKQSRDRPRWLPAP
jgi:hypothetical protein